MMSKRMMIIGAGGHGKVIADIAKLNHYNSILFLDDNAEVTSCGPYAVVGNTAAYTDYMDCDFIVAIGNNAVRQKIQTMLAKSGAKIAMLIHPSAVIADDVHIGKGTVIMAGAIVNPGSVIGNGCIINTVSSVDHDNTIGDFAHISPGAHLAGTVSVGKRTWIGIGACVSNNLSIGDDIIIGAGGVVIKDITEKGVYLGIPAIKR